MASSFQNEIPRARVNISLALETGGAVKKKELPFKILVMGDFSNGQAEGDVKDRERINITSNNLEQVMEDLSPKVTFSVPNRIKNDDSEIKVELTVDSFRSFHPEQVAYQIPQVSELLSMRNLLKDLKSNLLDNVSLRKEVERILNSEGDLNILKDQLKTLIADNKIKTEESAAE